MHPALFIDELLRNIMAFVLESDKKALVCAARTCRAWKDPALDLVWNRLPSLEPLLALLPGVSILQGKYITNKNLFSHNFDSYNEYARRVKHIRNSERIKLGPNMASLISISQRPQLPNLLSSYISMSRCNALLVPLNMSVNLQRLTIDIGFKSQEATLDAVLCSYLNQLRLHCRGLQYISLRGLASQNLNRIISSMNNVQSLSLRLGHSLLPNTLKSIAVFPHLQELDIHAGHMQAHEIEHLQVDCQRNFPTLRRLRIRAKSDLVKKFIHLIQSDMLCYVHIEFDDLHPPSCMDMVLANIVLKTSKTLRHLTLEHHFELSEDSVQSGVANTSQNLRQPLQRVAFDSLKILRDIASLQHFSCDLTLPPRLNDQELQSLLSWWPALEFLDLGTVPSVEGYDTADLLNLTSASLPSLSRICPQLRTLILPLSIDDEIFSLPELHINTFNQLRNITISHLSTSYPERLAKYLKQLFPSLINFDGPCDDSPAWSIARKAFQDAT